MKDNVAQPETPPTREMSAERILRIMAVAVAALCLASGLIQMVVAWRDPAQGAAMGLSHLGLFAAFGIALSGLLLGMSVIVRYSVSVQAALIRMEKYQYEVGAAASQKPTENLEVPVGDGTLSMFDPATGTTDAPQGQPPPWHEIVALLQQMRDNALLTDDERKQKREHAEEAEFAQAKELVTSLTAEGDFVRARQVIETFRARYPSSQRGRHLSEEHESHRERFESQDVRTITRQVEDLMSISAWPRARQLVQQLMERHPDSGEARQILMRVEKEHSTFQEEQRRRMHAEVQRFVSQKRWEEANVAAKTFVERFPGCAESEALLMQIPTLQNNAEIEVRQDLESRIMDYARHGRYIEAVDLARRLIERYPGSPQAEALRNQLPRLEELANNPDARPARVRVE